MYSYLIYCTHFRQSNHSVLNWIVSVVLSLCSCLHKLEPRNCCESSPRELKSGSYFLSRYIKSHPTMMLTQIAHILAKFDDSSAKSVQRLVTANLHLHRMLPVRRVQSALRHRSSPVWKIFLLFAAHECTYLCALTCAIEFAMEFTCNGLARIEFPSGGFEFTSREIK